jgi:hypothetical protein
VRRALLAAVALLSLAACSAPERPEGIVERWLLSLNQGSAGEPLRYGYRGVSDAVLPDWSSAETGTFDVIEVGPAAPCHERGLIATCVASVPFRIVTVDGDELRVDALVGWHGSSRDERPIRVFAITGADRRHRLPSEGGPPIGAAGATAWLVAIGVALALALVSELAMRIVRPRPTRLAAPHHG